MLNDQTNEQRVEKESSIWKELERVRRNAGSSWLCNAHKNNCENEHRKYHQDSWHGIASGIIVDKTSKQQQPRLDEIIGNLGLKSLKFLSRDQ